MEFIIQIRTTNDEAHVRTFGPAPDGKLPHEGDFIAMPLVYLRQHMEQIGQKLSTHPK